MERGLTERRQRRSALHPLMFDEGDARPADPGPFENTGGGALANAASPAKETRRDKTNLAG